MLSNIPAVGLQSAAAEDAEQLLGAVADEEQSHHQPEYEQCEVHADPPWSRGEVGGDTCLRKDFSNIPHRHSTISISKFNKSHRDRCITR
jgi:hypothetical protein